MRFASSVVEEDFEKYKYSRVLSIWRILIDGPKYLANSEREYHFRYISIDFVWFKLSRDTFQEARSATDDDSLTEGTVKSFLSTVRYCFIRIKQNASGLDVLQVPYYLWHHRTYFGYLPAAVAYSNTGTYTVLSGVYAT